MAYILAAARVYHANSGYRLMYRIITPKKNHVRTVEINCWVYKIRIDDLRH